MNRPVIALVSVLKPIDDTRMYEKIGLSLGESTKYDIKIIGFTANKPQYAPNINFFPLPFFKRVSFGRFYSHWHILKRLLQCKPQLIILMAPELLPLTPILKLLLKGKIIFDVQENYALNISTQGIYNGLWRFMGRALFWFGSLISRPFIDHYFLAEQIYAHQMPEYLPATILENKYAGTFPDRVRNNLYTTILFSGTLGKHTGIMETIDWVARLVTIDSSIKLNIIGYAPEEDFRKVLENKTKNLAWVDIQNSSGPVPHVEIIREIRRADAGVIWYNDHPSTHGKIPTKLYEYLALRLPVFMESRQEWIQLTTPYQASIPLDLTTSVDQNFLKLWRNTPFYTTLPGKEVTWKSEERKLFEIVEKLFLDL